MRLVAALPLVLAAGCGTVQQVTVPVPYPDPVPYLVTPVLPPWPVCDPLEVCDPTAPDPEPAQCAARNWTRIEACRAAWERYGTDVEAAVALAAARAAAETGAEQPYPGE